MSKCFHKDNTGLCDCGCMEQPNCVHTEETEQRCPSFDDRDIMLAYVDFDMRAFLNMMEGMSFNDAEKEARKEIQEEKI